MVLGRHGVVLGIVAHEKLLAVEDVLRLAGVSRGWRQLAISQLQLFKAVELNLRACQSALRIVEAPDMAECRLFPEAEELTFVNMLNAAFYEFVGQLPRMVEPSKLRHLTLRGLWSVPPQRVPSSADSRKVHMLREETCTNLETIRLELDYPYNDQLASWFANALHSAGHLRQLVWVMGPRPPSLVSNLRALTAGHVQDHVGIVAVGAFGQHTWRSWHQPACSFCMNLLQSLTVPASPRTASILRACVGSGDLPLLKDLTLVNGAGFETDGKDVQASAINDVLAAFSARPALGLRRLCLVGVTVPLACWKAGRAAESCASCLLHAAAVGHYVGFGQLEALACMNASDVGDFLGMTKMLASIPHLKEFVLSGAGGWTQFGAVPQLPYVASQLQTLVLDSAQLQSEQLDALCELLERGFAPVLADLAIARNAFSNSSLNNLLLRARPPHCRLHVDRVQARGCPHEELVIADDRSVWLQRWFQTTETAELLKYLPARCGFLARQQDDRKR